MIKAAYIYHHELKNTTAEDARKLDVINIAFAHCIKANFYFEHTDELAHINRLKQANPALRILISVGGWGSGGFSTMSSCEKTRKQFAVSCLEAVKKYSLDGIDIDWEYPCLDWGNIDASPNDRQNYTLTLSTVREVFDTYDRSLMLTVAVGNDSYFIENTEMDKVAKILDYVSIMTYDMRGCGDRLTGHHTNLFTPENKEIPRAHRSVEHSVRIYHNAGVPLEKIVIGIAFYSRMWKNVSSTENNGLWQDSDPGDYGPSYHEIRTEYLEKTAFSRYWDNTCKAPYLFDGKTFISYDDEESIALKCAYAKEQSLCGVMYWEHSCDKKRILLTALDSAAKQ